MSINNTCPFDLGRRGRPYHHTPCARCGVSYGDHAPWQRHRGKIVDDIYYPAQGTETYSTASLPGEEWKPVTFSGFDHYDVSSHGRVRSSVDSPKPLRPLSPQVNTAGYCCVLLKGGRRKRWYVSVHRLVAAAFLGPRPKGLVINHLDGQKENNAVSNLEYVTVAENNAHAVRNNLYRPNYGNRAGVSQKLSHHQVREIKTLLSNNGSPTAIARNFGVSPGTVFSIRAGRAWKSVN